MIPPQFGGRIKSEMTAAKQALSESLLFFKLSKSFKIKKASVLSIALREKTP